MEAAHVRLKSANQRDLIAGAFLLAVALVWIVLVCWTIPASQGPQAGPRAFPLFFGVSLAVLSLVLLAQSVFGSPERDAAPVSAAAPTELFSVLATIGSIVLYGATLETLGFLPSTALVVALIMVFVLRSRSPAMIVSMSIGLALGSYIVFGKLLGTYLPPGTVMPIYF
jgi:hypothetical protein